MAALGGVLALLAFTCSARPQDAQNACEREMLLAAKTSDVPVTVLYAVALTETGQRGRLQPYAMNIAGKPAAFATLPEALAGFSSARGRGAKLIDVGCMQINYHYHHRNFASVEEMFDPKRNVSYAADFLKRLYRQQGTWTAAVARYNAGPNNPPAQKSYVCAVLRNMVASGFGSWTASARNFCDTLRTSAR
jgi:soluble lytic murein transglycosylase-like protein